MSRASFLRAALLALLALDGAGCAQDHEAYVVQPGDTGFAIARRHGIAFSQLAELNPQVDWLRIRPGQRLRVTEPPADDQSNLFGPFWPDRLAPPLTWPPPAPRGATGVLVVYRGPRLRTIDPQIVASGLPVVDHLPARGHRLAHFEGRRPDGLDAFIGADPLRLEGSAVSRIAVEIPELSARRLAVQLHESDSPVRLPVAFWWQG